MYCVLPTYWYLKAIRSSYAQPIANTLNRHVTHIEGELISWQEESRRSKGTKAHATGLLVGEWSRPFCSWPWVGRLMGPKPVASEDQIGFSPDDRNWTDLVYIHIPYPRERGPTTECRPTPHFGLNFLLRSSVYSNMCPYVAALESAAQMHEMDGLYFK